MSHSCFIRLTVTNSTWVGVTKDSVLMPIGKITSLLKQGMWQLLGEVGVVNKPDIKEIKNLEILSSRRLLSSRCSHSTKTLDKLSQIGVNFYTHHVFQIVRSLVQERPDCVEKVSIFTRFSLELR